MPKPKYNDLWAMEPSYLEAMLSDGKSLELLSASDAVSIAPSSSSYGGEVLGNTAVLTLHGAIYRHSQVALRRELETALADSSISSIMVNINSPGGLVSGTKELADFIVSVRHIKPMAVYVDGLCASAAMWIASAFGTIYAPATASLGSVGVISILPNYAGLNKQLGRDYTYIKAGKWKAVGNSDFALTEEEKIYLQTRIDTLHCIFKDDVSKNLHLKNDVSWGEAQIFLAQEATDIGFVKVIVQDFTEACTQFQIKERNMDRKTLAEQHPELFQAVLDEGKQLAIINEEKAETAVQTSQENAPITNALIGSDANTNDLMTLLASILPQEQFANVQNIVGVCSSAGITLAQAIALTPLLSAQVNMQGMSDSQNTAPSVEANILANLQYLSSKPIDTTNGIQTPQTQSALIADAEKRQV